jgi:hypothetical protein
VKQLNYLINDSRNVLCIKLCARDSPQFTSAKQREHIKGRSSHVRLHMSTHDPNSFTAIKWKILISVSDTIAHQATESLFIRQESNLMNGCEGMDILPILQS